MVTITIGNSFTLRTGDRLLFYLVPGRIGFTFLLVSFVIFLFRLTMVTYVEMDITANKDFFALFADSLVVHACVTFFGIVESFDIIDQRAVLKRHLALNADTLLILSA